jgi:hypothetical protein
MVEKGEALSLLKSLYYEGVMAGASAALVRAGNLRLDDIGRRRSEDEICPAATAVRRDQ